MMLLLFFLAFFFSVATEYSYRLLQCCNPQFRLFDP